MFKKTGRDDLSSTTWHIALERKVYGQQQDSDGLQSLNRDHLILRCAKKISSTQLYHRQQLELLMEMDGSMLSWCLLPILTLPS